MNLQFPFNYKKSDDKSAIDNMAEDCYGNNEGFAGGFFPVGENNFWHNGIHLQARKGANDEELPVKPLADGHLIACRITDDYILAPVPRSMTEDRFNKINDKNKAKALEYYKKKGKKYIIIDEYKDKVLDDALKDELKDVLELRYSNNFALLKHSYKTPKNQSIDFFSLYMHLCPKNYYPEDKRPYFEEWTYKVNVEEDGSGVIFYDEEKKEEIGVVPFNSVIEILPGDNAPDRWYNESGSYGYHLVQAHALDMQVGVMKIRKDWKTANAVRKVFGRYDFTESTLIYDFNKNNKMYPVARTRESEKGFSTSVYDFSLPSDHWFFEAKKEDENANLSCLWIKAKDVEVLSGFIELNKDIKKSDDGSYEVVKETSLLVEESLYNNAKPEKVAITKLVKGQKLKEKISTNALPPWLKGRYIGVEIIIDKNSWVYDGKTKTHLKSIIDISNANRICFPKYLVNSSKETLAGGDYKKNECGLALYKDVKFYKEECKVVNKILEKGEKIVFQNDQAFLDKKYGEHKLSKELYSGDYLDLGGKGDSEGKVEIRWKLLKDLKKGEVNTLKEPLKVDINRIIGYTGQHLNQNKIIHLELFAGDNSFIDNPKKDGVEKSYYLVKSNTSGFKKVTPNIVKENVTIYPKTWFKLVTDKTKIGKSPYEKSIEVEVDSICVWLKRGDLEWLGEEKAYYKAAKDIEFGYLDLPKDGESGAKIKLDIKKGDHALSYRLLGDKEAMEWKGTDKNNVTWRYVYVKINNSDDRLKGWIKTDEIKVQDLSGYTGIKALKPGKIGNKYELKEKLEEWYKENPELTTFKDELSHPIADELKVKQKDVIEKVDKDDVTWFGFPLGSKDKDGKDIVGFIKKDELDGHKTIKLMNFFEWKTHFEELVEPEGLVNGKCDLMDLIFPVEESDSDDKKKKLLKKVDVNESTLKLGELFSKLKEDPELRMRLQQTYGCRPTEWSNKTDVDMNKYGVLGEVPQGKAQPEIDWLLENRVKPLQWWDDVKNGDLPEGFKLPDDPKLLYFFHPISFIRHMHNLVDLDVVSLIKSAELKDGWHQLEFKGKTLKISTGGYSAIKDALSRTNENRDPRYGKNRPATDKSFSENMIYTLKCFFNFLSDPEIVKCEDIKIIKITSTFRMNDKYKDANHMDALALDLGGDHFHYWSDYESIRNSLKFDREVALLIAKKLIEHGSPQIMLNCPYVKDNIAPFKKETVNTSYGSHHHHTHIGYLHKYSDSGTNAQHCSGVFNRKPYKCVNYDNCTGYDGKK